MNYIKYFIISVVTIFLWSCTKDSDMGESGTGGSMARFTIKGEYLYAVDEQNLQVFHIASATTAQVVDKQNVGWGIETIFPTANHLFLGANNGMYIYSLRNPAKPERISFTPHFVSYDPVVVQDNLAYVTLRQGENFWGRANMLQIYDISRLSNPVLLKEYSMSGPKGLGIDGDKLFICDNVLKVYKVTNGIELDLLHTFNIPAIDVIPDKNWLYVVAEDGFHQYSYENDEISFVSKITIPKN
jgi:hypothetical protein